VAEQTLAQNEVNKGPYTIAITREPSCRAKLTVTVAPEGVTKAYKNAIKLINKEVSIPGFRKGKAPEATLVKHYAKYIDEEWRKEAANDALSNAMEITGLKPLKNDKFKQPQLKKLNHDEGGIFSFEFEHYPEVPTVEISDLSISKSSPEPVTDAKIAEGIEDLRHMYAEEQKVEGRPAHKGDVVYLDIDLIEEDKKICENKPFDLDEKFMAQWMYDVVVGKNIGDVVEGESVYQENMNIPIEKFKATKCKIKICAIGEKKKPENEQALAEKMGVESVETMRENIRKDLDHRSLAAAVEKDCEQVTKILIEKYPFELPDSFLAEERKVLMTNRLKALKEERVPDETIMKMEGELEEQVSEEVKKSYILFFLAHNLAEKGREFTDRVSERDVSYEMMRQFYQVPLADRIINEKMDENHIRRRIYMKLLVDQFLTFLSHKAAA